MNKLVVTDSEKKKPKKQVNPKVQQHKELCIEINKLYARKNAAYGDSFKDAWDDFGITSAAMRLNDKMNRIKTLVKNPKIPKGDESIRDTLVDLANYALMAVMELDNDKKK